MTESKSKSKTTKSESTSTSSSKTKKEDLKVFNFTRDGVVIKAKNRKEAEKLFKEQNKSKEDN